VLDGNALNGSSSASAPVGNGSVPWRRQWRAGGVMAVGSTTRASAEPS